MKIKCGVAYMTEMEKRFWRETAAGFVRLIF